MVTMHGDCFAKPRLRKWKEGEIVECDALSSSQSKDCAYCAFYKPERQNDLELLLHHGTCDIQKILERYSGRSALR